jgi:hypothetical protein
MAQYVAPLAKYYMTLRTASDVGRWVLYEAPEPWGPWTVVERYTNWCGHGSTIGEMLRRSIAPKWISPDGSEFWMLFSGTGIWDRFNLIKGTFQFQ